MSLDRKDALRLAAALLFAVSGGIHVRLFRAQYRDIHVDRILGVDFAGSFVLAVVAATIVSILLVVTVIWSRGATVASTVGIIYSAGAIAAYALSRTIGLLGFEERGWIPEAAVAKPVELMAVVLLALTVAPVLGSRRVRQPAR